ncbi:MAG: Hpt domain-containing protein [Pseudomonadota bacterium]
MSAAAAFDVGPLAWVRGEIDLALDEVRAHLAEFSACPENAAPLAAAQAPLHQVGGALRMVGLDGAARITDAMEAVLAVLRENKIEIAAWRSLDRAALALGQFVADLMGGAANRPLQLFPVYRELSEAVGNAAHPGDLFYPDLAELPAKPTLAAPLPPRQWSELMTAQRAAFQRGLLAWLKQDARGSAEMRAALEKVEAAQSRPAERMFWRSAGAFIEALGACGLDEQALGEARQLCARLDLQLRRIAAAPSPVAERLARDVLYFLARTHAGTPLIEEIRHHYRLDTLLPAATEEAYGEERVEKLRRAMAERVERAKVAWLAYTSGDAGRLLEVGRELAELKTLAADGGNDGLKRLLGALHDIAATLPGNFSAAPQALALEVATALLLAENLLAELAAPASYGAAAIDAMLARLRAVSRGEAPEKLSGLPLLDEASRHAQEKITLAQVAHEMRASLGQIEQALDAFFRDPEQRAMLPGLAANFAQILGACDMLAWDQAAALLRACQARVDRLADVQYRPGTGEFELLAEALAAAGFYLDAIEHGAVQAEQAVADALQRLQQGVPLAPPAPGPHVPGQASLEDQIAQRRAALAGLFDAWWGEPQDAARRTALREALETLAQDAQLIADAVLARVMEDALAALARDDGEEVHAAIVRITGVPVAPPAPFAQPTAAAPAAVDDELLAVYLEEAEQVLTAVTEQLAACRANPQDRNALAEIRRGFHTLKGSGRTIGMMELGEAAWRVEQVLDRWLEGGRKITPALLDFIGAAHAAFRNWAQTLEQGGTVAVQAEDWFAHAERLLGDVAVPAAAPAGAGEVQVGTVKLPAELYAIFTDEAARHLATLAGTPASLPVSSGALRAAHTLAGIARTAGFAAMAELAAALEQHLAGAPQAQAVERAVAALDAMLQAIRRRELPPADAGALAGLTATHEPVRAAGVQPDRPDVLLLPVFLAEAGELLATIVERLRSWQSAPLDEAASLDLRRALHTLKSSARTVGAMQLGEQAHELEAQVADALAAGGAADLLAAAGHMTESLERLRRGEAPATLLHISPAVIARLVGEVGEASIARARMASEVDGLRAALGDLNNSVVKLAGQLRDLEIEAESQLASGHGVRTAGIAEFDPLEFDRYTRLQELTRFLAESVNDVATVRQSLLKNVVAADAALAQQGHVMRDLQQGLLHLRLAPFASLTERLQRVVRQSAQECERQARLEIRGGDVELECGLLDRLAAPLEHLLRNAVVHGIEAAPVRAAHGKAAEGTVRIEIGYQGDEAVLTLADDGAGLDHAAILDKARQLGLVAADSVLSEQQIEELIFLPGVSTAQKVTPLSGRGIGMNAVKTGVALMNGCIEVTTRPGLGTTVTLRLPLSVPVVQAALVRIGAAVYALPGYFVAQVQELKPAAMHSLLKAGNLDWQGVSYPLHYLAHLLGEPIFEPEQRPYYPVLLLQGGARRVALLVDEVLRQEEVVVKPLPPQLAGMAGLSGATVLGSGRAALIVNPFRLQGPTQQPAVAEVVKEEVYSPLVMVVDDSITVRKVTGRLLQRAGYRVTEAKDGVEALQMIGVAMPDAVLLDIEMPRMDGFELTGHLRALPRSANLPIIMITSRSADKHRNHALALGVNVYLGKPFQEVELLQHLAALARRPAGQRVA